MQRAAKVGDTGTDKLIRVNDSDGYDDCDSDNDPHNNVDSNDDDAC